MSKELKLSGNQTDIQRLELSCRGCDFTDAENQVIDTLMGQQDANNLEITKNGRWAWFKNQPLRKQNARITLLLKNEKHFAKFMQRVLFEAKQDLLDSGRVGEFGDGQFMKWWFEWFSNGGAEKLIEFIGELFEIIMTVIVCAPWLGYAVAGAIVASLLAIADGVFLLFA